MTWFPVGPDFVFWPRETPYRRLSRTNEFGAQAMVHSITVDPTDGNVLYIAERPASGGATAFRSDDGGRSWIPIADQFSTSEADPSCFAVNPTRSYQVLMGCFDARCIWISDSRGQRDTWRRSNYDGGKVRALWFAPDGNTVLAASETGLHRSANSGSDFSPVTVAGQPMSGDVRSLAADTTDPAQPIVYAGVSWQGVLRSAAPYTDWTLLNDDVRLPRQIPRITGQPIGNFRHVLVAVCARHPARVYALFTDASGDYAFTRALYTTGDALGAWDRVPTSPNEGERIPNPFSDYCLTFAVAPNSPGIPEAGQQFPNDILLFGGMYLYRSIDGGRVWTAEQMGFHVDQHAIAFAPGSKDIPITFIGSDGGISRNLRLADPTFPITGPFPHHNQNAAQDVEGLFENMNHGKQSLGLYGYTAGPGFGALGYTSSQDTDLACTLGYHAARGLVEAGDGGTAMCCTQGDDGVKIWTVHGGYGQHPYHRMRMHTDEGDWPVRGTDCWFGDPADNRVVEPTSLAMRDSEDECVVGAAFGTPLTKVRHPIAPGVFVVTPDSINGIQPGMDLIVDGERVVVDGVDPQARTFTARFQYGHGGGRTLDVMRQETAVVRIATNAIAYRLSPDFGGWSTRHVISIGMTTPLTHVYCATHDQVVWRKPNAELSGITPWRRVDRNQPAGTQISDLAVDAGGRCYVLLSHSVDTDTAGVQTRSPLFLLEPDPNDPQSESWVHLNCPGLDSTAELKRLVAHPKQPAVLYVSQANLVYELTVDAAARSCTWRVMGDPLPGSVRDLWICGPFRYDDPQILLRAALSNRGVWETELSSESDPPKIVDVFVRDNLLDLGWLTPAPSGEYAPNPQRPAERYWYYQCPDIRIDVEQTEGALRFYRTGDVGAALPVDHTRFEQLPEVDELPAGRAALVHVQVHNRCTFYAWPVTHVWVLYTPASIGLANFDALENSADTFPFWEQFTLDGILPNLPADSAWKAVGAPQTVPGAIADSPAIASWEWTVPDDLIGFKYAFAVFAYAHPDMIAPPELDVGGVAVKSTAVEDVVKACRQVGLKNVYVVNGMGKLPMRFHNPDAVARKANLRVDARPLPAGARLRLSLEDGAAAKTKVRAPAARKKPVERRLHEGTGGAILEIADVELAAHASISATLEVQFDSELKRETRLEAQQWVAGRLAGGGTYIIRPPEIARKFAPPPQKPPRDPELTDAEWQQRKREARAQKYLSPWAGREVAVRWEEFHPAPRNPEEPPSAS